MYLSRSHSVHFGLRHSSVKFLNTIRVATHFSHVLRENAIHLVSQVVLHLSPTRLHAAFRHGIATGGVLDKNSSRVSPSRSWINILSYQWDLSIRYTDAAQGLSIRVSTISVSRLGFPVSRVSLLSRVTHLECQRMWNGVVWGTLAIHSLLWCHLFFSGYWQRQRPETETETENFVGELKASHTLPFNTCIFVSLFAPSLSVSLSLCLYTSSYIQRREHTHLLNPLFPHSSPLFVRFKVPWFQWMSSSKRCVNLISCASFFPPPPPSSSSS